MSTNKITAHNREDDQDAYEDNYEFNRGIFCRNVFLFHLLEGMLKVRKRVHELYDQEEKLQAKDIPNIKYEDNPKLLSQKLMEEIESIMRESDEE